MVKILKYISYSFLILVFSCSLEQRHFLENEVNFEVELAPWLMFDYKTRNLRLEFPKGDVLIDSVYFTSDENKKIVNAFEKSKIFNMYGEHWIGKASSYPTDMITIRVYNKDSTNLVLHCSPDYNGVNLSERKVGEFTRIILDILYNKNEYKKMFQELLNRQEKYNEYFF